MKYCPIIKVHCEATSTINKFGNSEVPKGSKWHMTVKSLAKDDIDSNKW